MKDYEHSLLFLIIVVTLLVTAYLTFTHPDAFIPVQNFINPR
jgi:hypothetical protein